MCHNYQHIDTTSERKRKSYYCTFCDKAAQLICKKSEVILNIGTDYNESAVTKRRFKED